MTCSPIDFAFVRDFLHQRAAIALEPGKEYLVESRLGQLARAEGLESLSALIAVLRVVPPSAPLCQRVIEAMTIHETSFFRDLSAYKALREEIIPALLARRAPKRRLTIWCAASSTGQEPYSVLMLLHEYFPQLHDWSIRFVASDISTQVIEKARSGRYTQLEVNRGLPAPILVKYFQKSGQEWQVKDSIRRAIEFQRINLNEEPPAFGPIDLLMVRNVLIYFDAPTKRAVLGRLRRALAPDGFLMLGTTETLGGGVGDLEPFGNPQGGGYTPRPR
jgi:chemotaxis protein methyltransferase CheR